MSFSSFVKQKGYSLAAAAILLFALVHSWDELRDKFSPAPKVDIFRNKSITRYAFVTGGTKGIGFEYCRQLVVRDLGCVFTGTSQQSMDKAMSKFVKEFPQAKFVGLVMNILDTEGSTATIEKTFKELDPALVALNADWELQEPSTFLSSKALQGMVQGNVVTNTMISQYFVKRWIQTKQTGILLGISSVATPFPIQSADAYSATRAYQSRYWEILRDHCERHYSQYVRVVLVETGPVSTEAFKKLPKDLYERGEPLSFPPREFVQQVLFQVFEQNRRHVIVGQAFKVLKTLQKFGINFDLGEYPVMERDFDHLEFQFIPDEHPFKKQLQ